MDGSGLAPPTNNIGCRRAGIFGTHSPRSAIRLCDQREWQASRRRPRARRLLDRRADGAGRALHQGSGWLGYRAEIQSLRSVDDLVGSVEDALNTAGKLDNTVIIYTSDNGYVYGDHRLFGKNSVYVPRSECL